jgi:hypothetical protein
MTFPFHELNMRDPEHVDWVKSRRDPELWHVAAIAVLIYLGDPRGFLVWLMDQPGTDRATAGYLFFGAQGSGYLRGQTDWLGEGLSDQEWLHALHAICRRAAGVGFTNDALGLHPGFEAERQVCLYFIEDGAVLDYDPGVS